MKYLEILHVHVKLPRGEEEPTKKTSESYLTEKPSLPRQVGNETNYAIEYFEYFEFTSKCQDKCVQF